MLRPIDGGIWIADGPDVSFHGFPYPTRMVVVRLVGGDLWVWSPVALTSDLLDALARIGPVKHLVSPNKLHHLFLTQWRTSFPQAHIWGPASTVAKRPDLTFGPALTDQPPAEWEHEIDQAWFRGSPLLDEIVFFHKASRTAIFADLVQAFSDEFLRARWKPWQRALARHVEGITLSAGAHAPLEWRLSFFNWRSTRMARAKALGWAAERVVMAHGQWQGHGGSTFIQRSLSWLDD